MVRGNVIREAGAKMSHIGAEELVLSAMIPSAIAHGNFHLKIRIACS
jgi:hypothetical protein